MKINVDPRKNSGATCSMLTGETTMYKKTNMMRTPIHLEWTPVRYVKIVWEKMYDPVNPKVNPDITARIDVQVRRIV